MNEMFSQGGKGSTGILTNKQAIARVFGIKQTEVAYLVVGAPVLGSIILYDKETQTCWYTNGSTGTVTSWTIMQDVLTLVTSTGTYTLKKALLWSNKTLDIKAPDTYAGQNTRDQIRAREAALTSNKVRFVTWNSQGAHSAYTYYGNDYANRQRVVDMTDWYLRMGADFVGGQEAYLVSDLPVADLAIYPYISAFHSNSMWFGTSRNYGNQVVATRPLQNSTGVKFASAPLPESTDTEYRSYVRTEMVVNGVTIAIYNTHLALEPVRYRAMIQELATTLQTETASHVVLMGDWNTQDDTDFSPLIPLGFNMVNHYGEINTNNVGGTWYLDRIFHKGFSSQGDYGAFDTPISLGDHKPLYVDLII